MDEVKPAGWWGRNWKWVVPVGCLGTLLISVAVCGGVFMLIFSFVKSSWAYTEGVNLARHNATVVAELGEPIEPGWAATGSVNVNGSSGDADLTIPLSGPKNSGTLYVVAQSARTSGSSSGPRWKSRGDPSGSICLRRTRKREADAARWVPCPRLRGHVATPPTIFMPTRAWAWHPAHADFAALRYK